MRLLEIIIHIFEYPFLTLLYFTALPVSNSHYSKLRCVLYPVPGFCFIMFVVKKSFDMDYLYYPLPAGLLVSVIFLMVLDKK